MKNDKASMYSHTGTSEREKRTMLDDFTLSDNYDFSDGIRGRFYQPKKVTTTIQLDNDILLFLKEQASEKHMDYQTLLNVLLRDYMSRVIR
jgi:predicted DNA binding CopG/RHH family protein